MATKLEFITKAVIDRDLSSLTVDNCFSAEYDVYQIHFKNFKYTTTQQWCNTRFLDSSGNEISAGVYNYGLFNMYSQGAFQYYPGSSTTQLTYFPNWLSDYAGNTQIATIYRPYDSSSWTFVTYIANQWVGTSSDLYSNLYVGTCKQAQIHRGFKINPSANFNEGEVTVFGVK